jgi:hypothetical protein
MATVTRSPKSPAPASEPKKGPSAVPDSTPSYFGDRIAFIIWLTCALFLASLLTYDTVIGLFR